MRLTRRSMLAGAAASLASVAGCVGRGAPPADQGDDPTDDPGGDDPADCGDCDSVPVLTGHAVSDSTVTPDTARDADGHPYGLYLGSRAAVKRHFGAIAADGVAAFVEATDFEAGDRLVYVEAIGNDSCHELVLAGDPAVSESGEPTVPTAVRDTADENVVCTQAVTPVNLLVRLSFDPDAKMPGGVTVRVDDGAETTALRLEDEV